jgi:hypothetical protein
MKFAFTLLTIVLLVGTVFGQLSAGSLVGTVVDQNGGAVAGATVEVTDNATSKVRTVQATTDGTFTVPQLDVGTYTVKVTAQGFKAFTATELKIDVGKQYSLAVTLEPGGVNENVTVVAGADVLNATTAELSNTVSSRQIQELPLNGRNPLVLLTLQPGAASNGATNTAINGQRTSFTNITRDGINIQDNFIRANATDFAPQRPGVDDISQFTVTTSNADAALGYGASQVNIATERGQSEFHGTLFEYNRNSKFSSRPFFSNTRPFLNRNQFGFKVGGPAPLPKFGEGGASIFRNKAFYFFNYEGFRQRQTTNALKTILLPSARNGIFTYVDNAGTTRTINILNIPIADPFAGGTYTIGSVNPAVQSRVLQFVPTAGNTTDAGDQRNTTGFRINVANNVDRNNFTGRFDVEPNSRNSFNFIYAHGNENNDRPDIASGYQVAPLVVQPATRDFLSTGWTWTPSATLTNELRGGFFLSEPVFNRVNPEGAFLLSVPLISNPAATFQNQGRKADNYTITDNATWVGGNHTLRFGGTVTWFKTNSFAHFDTVPRFSLQLNGATGQFVAANFPGGLSSAQLTAANNLAALLGGVAGRIDQTFNATTTTSGYVAGAPQRQIFDYENYGFYATDQWRIGQRLTLNLGARYEIYSALRERNGFALEPVLGSDPIASLLSPTGTVDFIGHNGGGNRFYHTDKNNIGPVLSFAWSPEFKNKLLGSLFGSGGRTVIRGGYRISYVNDEFIRAPDNAQGGNSGLSTSQAFGLTSLDGNRLGGPLAVLDTPDFSIPRSFATGNTLSGTNFGTIFAIDPDLENPATHEWNFGIQREIGFQTALEVRYVGGKSDNLVRGLDFNELKIISNGFLTGFNLAVINAQLSQAKNQAEAAAGVPAANRTPVSGAFNASVPGSQSLAGTVFSNNTLPGNGFLGTSTVVNNLLAGVPSDLANAYVTGVSTFGLANAQAFSKFFSPNPNAGAVDFLTNGGKYRYHSLQTEIRRRFSNGFHLQANYTFQKTLTNASGVGQTNFEPNLSNLFPEIEYSRADYDATHVFNLNTIYELPFGRGKRWFSDVGGLDRLVGGWQVTSILQMATGAPITITDPRGTLTRRNARQTANSNLSKDEIKDLIGIFRTPCGVFFINPAVIDLNQTALANGQCGSLLTGGATGRGARGFGQSTFPGQVFFNVQPGQTGTLERAFINGPLYVNWDASLIKNIRITERTKFQLRFEAFNVLNRANFFATQFGNLNINSTNFGRISTTFTSSGAQRVIQFAGRFEW